VLGAGAICCWLELVLGGPRSIAMAGIVAMMICQPIAA